MKDKHIALLESRFETSMADLVARAGGIPLSAPAIAEVPDLDPARLARQLDAWQTDPPAAVIFQTGVGVKALLKATDELGRTAELLALLEKSTNVVRGAKPTGPLRARGIRVDRTAAEPYTTTELIAALVDLDLDGRHVLVQRFGEKNLALEEALHRQGARISEIPVYRYGLPENTEPLRLLIRRLVERSLDAVVFTSASQVTNLVDFATAHGGWEAVREGLQQTLVVSVGPVCTAMLQRHGIPVQVEASPPKLGPLMAALEAALSPLDGADSL